jgi:hypothetical protein
VLLLFTLGLITLGLMAKPMLVTPGESVLYRKALSVM